MAHLSKYRDKAYRRLFRTQEIPKELNPLTDIDNREETDPKLTCLDPGAVDTVWQACEDLYRTGVYPMLSLCVRRRSEIVINRALGHSREDKVASINTPVCLFSASKAITAVLIHLLAEQGKFIFGSHWEDELGNIVDPGTEGATKIENISMLIDDPVKSRRMSQALAEASLKAQKDLSDEQIKQQKALIELQGREERKTQKEGDFVGNMFRWATGQKG